MNMVLTWRLLTDATRIDLRTPAILGIDYIGPYIKDVDGNVLAMTGVEVGRTNYGMIRLTKDREAKG